MDAAVVDAEAVAVVAAAGVAGVAAPAVVAGGAAAATHGEVAASANVQIVDNRKPQPPWAAGASLLLVRPLNGAAKVGANAQQSQYQACTPELHQPLSSRAPHAWWVDIGIAKQLQQKFLFCSQN